jgi:nucleoside-diphosphate-sugar epimerase
VRTLILGASGYLGRHLVARLCEAGHAVTGAVRSGAAGGIVAAHGGSALIGALGDPDFLQAALAGADTVIWAAQLMLAEERAVIDRVLAALSGSGKTFVFTGGTSLLSDFTGGAWSENTFTEHDRFVPRRQIAARLDTENAVRAADGAGLRTICVRPPLIWGGAPIKLIADLYHAARETGSVCHLGSGLACYSTVHVDDLAELYRLAIERGAGGALYHAVSGETSFRHLAETVAHHLGTGTRSIGLEEAEALWDRFTARIVFGSCSRSRSPRALSDLGWSPREDRLDLLGECTREYYAAGVTRKTASWVAPARPSGRHSGS